MCVVKKCYVSLKKIGVKRCHSLKKVENHWSKSYFKAYFSFRRIALFYRLSMTFESMFDSNLTYIHPSDQKTVSQTELVMGNDHEVEFQEIKSCISQEVERTIRRLKFFFFRRSKVSIIFAKKFQEIESFLSCFSGDQKLKLHYKFIIYFRSCTCSCIISL